MGGQARVSDITIGACPPGTPGPAWLGIWVLGSQNHLTNNLSSIRMFDLAIHACYHGPNIMEFAMQGSPNKNINNLPAHREMDMTVGACGGVGLTILGSANSRVNS